MVRLIRRWAAPAAAVALICFATAPVDAKTLDEILSAKKVVVGVNSSLPPLASYNDKNELDGFDVEFAKKIAELMGVEVEFVKVGPNDRVPFVASGKIDFVMGAMTRTLARAKVVDYTVPLITEALAVVTTEGKPYAQWQNLNDPAVRLVAIRGTTPVKLIQENIPKAQRLLLDDHPDSIRAIAQGRADATITVVETELQFMNSYKDVKWKVLKAPIKTYYNGLAVARGNESLRLWLNLAIFELQSSGYVDDLWKKWFKTDNTFRVEPNPYF